MTKLPLSTFLLLLLLLFSTLTVAEITSFTISNDSRPTILINKFRFTQTGLITISLSSVSVSSSQLPKLGFFLLSDISLPRVLLEFHRNLTFCLLDSRHVIPLLTFRNHSQFKQSNSIISRDDYSLFFTNCIPETKVVSMKIQIEMYNLDSNGFKDYLPTGLTELPGLYFVFSLCYLGFVTFWVYYCYKNKQMVQKVHLLMFILLSVKTICLICVTEVKHNVKVTGTAQNWNIPHYVFRFIENVLFMVLIVLLGTSWSLSKVKQEKKKKKLLLMVVMILVQVLANIASVVTRENGVFSKNWVIWNQIFLLADIVSCFAIIFVCCGLRRDTSKAAKDLAKLQLFRRFYVLVIVYLIFVRIGVFLLDIIVDCKYQWVSYAAEETASLAFYVTMFSMFRPMQRNEYIGVQEEEDDQS